MTLDNEVENQGDIVSLSGEVVEVLPNTRYKVKLSNGIIVLAHSSGRIRKNRIKILQFDKVDVEISLSDAKNLANPNIMVNARITFRHKS